jgi:hypothetical protein
MGNQMFQYAAARSLAEHRNTILKVDVSPLVPSDPRGRTYGLGCFCHSADIASSEEINDLTRRNATWVMRACHKVKESLLPCYRQSVFGERSRFRVDPCFYALKPPVYLWGYWQAVGYLQSVQAQIRKEFQFVDPPQGRNATLAAEISRSTSVAVHVRRGDYASDPIVRDKHGLCSVAYYKRCIEHLQRSEKHPVFFVFSDEPEWARSHLRINAPTVFVTNNGIDDSHLDLQLMTLCKHHIIANSSFSWWGAWLSTSTGKKVYTPQKWLADGKVDTSGLIPGSWTRLAP